MKIKINDFLTAEQLGEANKNNPAHAVIVDINFIEADDLPFESNKGKYELTLEIGGEETKWMSNKTSLKASVSSFGSDGDSWDRNRVCRIRRNVLCT